MKRHFVLLFVIAYGVSTVLCTCRVHAQSRPQKDAHACCHHDRPSEPVEAPHPERCPHCDGSISSAVSEKQASTPVDCFTVITPSLTTVSAIAPIALCPDAVSLSPSLPPNTLLQLHCALLT